MRPDPGPWFTRERLIQVEDLLARVRQVPADLALLAEFEPRSLPRAFGLWLLVGPTAAILTAMRALIIWKLGHGTR